MLAHCMSYLIVVFQARFTNRRTGRQPSPHCDSHRAEEDLQIILPVLGSCLPACVQDLIAVAVMIGCLDRVGN